jgi:urease subunit alpha
MFGAAPLVASATSRTFVAPAALEAGLDHLGCASRPARWPTPGAWARPTCRELGDAAGAGDPDSFAVRIDGELVEPDPVAELPMAQRYFLF